MEEHLKLGAAIRRRRRHLNLTLAAVARGSGLSVPYLSQVERDQANPTIAALSGVARALGVSLSYFVPDAGESAFVARGIQLEDIRVGELGYRVQRLAGGGGAAQLEPLLVHVPPGFEGTASTHPGEEFLYVLSGRLRLSVGGETHDLGAGDSAHHPSMLAHAWANPGDLNSVLVWVGTPRLFS